MGLRIRLRRDDCGDDVAGRMKGGFRVRRTACSTCIYRSDSPLDIARLEAEVKNQWGFTGYRVCHHTEKACCRGFWNRHKDGFQIGQIAQRLGMVVFVDEDHVHV